MKKLPRKTQREYVAQKARSPFLLARGQAILNSRTPLTKTAFRAAMRKARGHEDNATLPTIALAREAFRLGLL